MSKWVLQQKLFMIDKKNISIMPTIWICKDRLEYAEPNISFEFHFLSLHAGLLFFKERGGRE